MKIEHVETRETFFTAPEPIYVEEWWGPEGRKWLMTRVINNPHRVFFKKEGKTYHDGVFFGKWVQYINRKEET